MTDDLETIRERGERARTASRLLRSSTSEERADWLTRSGARVLREIDGDAALREVLVAETGLSEPMVRWAAETTLSTVERGGLIELERQARRGAVRDAEPVEMLSVILAGNVFTAAVRAIFIPLQLGVPVLVKPSTGQSRFVDLLATALRGANADLGRAVETVSFRGGDLSSEARFLAVARVASIYGSDRTVEAMASRLPPNLRLIRHGHGLSAAYCSAEAVAPAAIEGTASRLAVDVAAYDQRGCLSPQVVYVQSANAQSAERLAEETSIALEALEQRLPRGPLPDHAAAAQTQWRGLAEIEGTLYRGKTHALASVPAASVRWSPGYRNVSVVAVPGLDQAFNAMSPFAPNLKCLGIDSMRLNDVTDRLTASSWPAYAAPLGTMQTPPLDAPADGRPATDGLLEASPVKRR